MSFVQNLEHELIHGEHNVSITENGAVGYRSSGKALVDFNFSISSMRNMFESDILDLFFKMYFEDKLTAIKYLFFATDVRGGMGERRLFKICYKAIALKNPELATAMIPFVPYYGRWDSLFCLFDTKCEAAMIAYLKEQLEIDKRGMEHDKPISLLAKWLPSYQATNEESKRIARKIYRKLGFKSPKEYRHTVSALRHYIDVVEKRMCDNEWDKIVYEHVPSKANLIYKNAFMKHDEERRKAYLESLTKGETKINASTLYPHEIVCKYPYYNIDDTLESLWKALPDYVNSASNTLCVCDTSGSMNTKAGQNSTVTCMDVAFGLTIYFSEKCTGEFKDTFITFSERPKILNMSGCTSLADKIRYLRCHREDARNTNIEAVFNLVLNTAVHNNMKQEDLPKNILILSDMEFDRGVKTAYNECADKALFDTIKERYNEAEYELPRLVFWNINSRTGTIPITENDLGVALVSGYSPSISDMVLSEELDPYKLILNKLSTERYQPLDKLVKYTM